MIFDLVIACDLHIVYAANLPPTIHQVFLSWSAKRVGKKNRVKVLSVSETT